jgi:hypothetical protein
MIVHYWLRLCRLHVRRHRRGSWEFSIFAVIAMLA